MPRSRPPHHAPQRHNPYPPSPPPHHRRSASYDRLSPSPQRQRWRGGSEKRHDRRGSHGIAQRITVALLKQQLQLDTLPHTDGPKTLFLGNLPHAMASEADYRAFLELDTLFNEPIDVGQNDAQNHSTDRQREESPVRDAHAESEHAGALPPIRTRFIQQTRIGFVTLRSHIDALKLRDALLDKRDRAQRQISQSRRPGAPRNLDEATLEHLHQVASFRVNWATNMDDIAKGRGFYIFVRNLPTEVTDMMLERFFKLKYHEHVRKARVVVEQDSGVSKGFGWVSFSDAKVRQQAFQEMHREFFGAKRIRVSLVVRRGQFTEHEDDTEETDRAEERMLAQEYEDRSISIEGLTREITNNQIMAELLRHVPEEARRRLNPRAPRVFEHFIRSEDGIMAFVRLPATEVAEHMVQRLNGRTFLGCFVNVHLTNMALAKYQIHSEKQWRQYFSTVHQQQLTVQRIFEKQQPQNFEDNPLKAYNVSRSNAQYAESDLSAVTLMEMDW